MGSKSSAMSELQTRFNKLTGTGRLGESFTKIAGAVRSLETLHEHRDLTMPQEHHVLKVGKAAASLAQRLDLMKQSALDAYAQESGRISGQIVDRLNLKESRHGEELRRLLVTMPLSERIEFVTGLANDPESGSLIASLTNAPAVLHGVPKDVLQATEKAFISKHAPDLVQMQEALDDGLSLVSACHRTASVMSSEYQNPSELARISEASARAAKAAQDMQEALA